MSARPYPGLRPFTRQEQSVFFGREAHIAYVVKKLARTRFVSIVGVSGCGKSSLVRAGLIPELERSADDTGTRWQVVIMRPGSSPFQNLTEALFQNTTLAQAFSASAGAQTVEARRAFVSDSLYSRPLSLVEMIGSASLPEKFHLLLVVDQFEELFRPSILNRQDDAAAFVALLLASVRQKEIPISVVLTMRADVIGECARFQGLPQRMNAGQFLVPHLTRKQQRDAICKPAEVSGGKVEPDLVGHLLDESGDDPDQLPVLQHCLMRMWAVAASQAGEMNATSQGEKEGISLTLAHYEAVGGLSHALSWHADEAYMELDATGQRVAEAIFRCLSERGIDRRDVRRPTPLQDIAAVASVSIQDVQEVAEVFRRPDRCFLTPPVGTLLQSDTVLDISHESLIRRWDRMNTWADEEAKSAQIYQRLEQTARLWAAGEAALWTTPDLEHALDWNDQAHPTSAWAQRYSMFPVSEPSQADNGLMESERPQGENDGFQLAMTFLTASKEAQEAQRLQEERERQRALRRTRWQLAFVSLGFVIVLAVALWGWWERQHREQALQEKEIALAARQQVLVEKEEFIDFVSSQLDTTHTNFDNGIRSAQAALSLLSNQYLPTWESLLESKIDALSTELEAIDVRNQRNALCCEKLWLEGDTDVFSETFMNYDMSQEVVDTGVTKDLLVAFYTFLNQEATLVQEENKKRFITFYKGFLQILKREIGNEPIDPESLLNVINDELNKYLVLLNTLPSFFNARYSDIDIGYVNAPQNLTQNSTDPELFKQNILLPYIATIYKKGLQDEIRYVDESLLKKGEELAAISDGINALQDDLNMARMNKESALASLRQHLDSAFRSYDEAARTFENMQGVVDAMVADAALQDGHYEKAIRFALRALVASPDTLSSYETLILTLPQLSGQTALSHTFLDEIFQELVSFSDMLAVEGRIGTLGREHKTYLSRIYYECSRCYATGQDVEKAAVAVERAIAIAELIEKNEANIARLRRWQKALNNQTK